MKKDLILYHKVKTFIDPEKRGLLKTLLEKEQMLETSIIFSQNVLYSIKEKLLNLSHYEIIICKCFRFR